MSDIIRVYNENDLFVYLQKVRLETSKRVNDSNIEKSKNVKEEKTTFKTTMKNVGNFFKRGVNNYDKKGEDIAKQLETFSEKHADIMSEVSLNDTVTSLFEEDKYGLAKLLFATTVILDDEYKYHYAQDGLEEASNILYGDKNALLEIKEQLEANYRAISPTSLSSIQKGILIGVAIAGTIVMPIILGAAVAGIVYGGMKMYNISKVKKEIASLSPEKHALYLAIQCTYIQRIKKTLPVDEFKEQLDSILKNLSTLKSDLDYFLFVENESTKNNKMKVQSFHEFDNRLAKVLKI